MTTRLSRAYRYGLAGAGSAMLVLAAFAGIAGAQTPPDVAPQSDLTASSTMPSADASATALDASTQGMAASTSTISATSTTSPSLSSGSTTIPLLNLNAANNGGADATVAAAPLAAATSPAPMVVSVSDSGNTLIRGVVQTVGPDTLTIASWGGTWTIRTAGITQVTPTPTTAGDLSAIRVGDFVGAAGVTASDQPWTVNAQYVRDWTLAPPALGSASASQTSYSGSTSTSVSALPQSASGTEDQSDQSITGTTPNTATTSASGATGSTTSSLNSSTPSALSPQSGLPSGTQLYTGTASNINATDGTFTLTDDTGTVYTVATDANTTFWNTNSSDISLASMSDGDRIRLDGSLTGTTIEASVVRDTAL